MDVKNAELRQVQEELIRFRKESERQASKNKLLETGTSSQREMELRDEKDNLLVNVSFYSSLEAVWLMDSHRPY